MSICFLLLCRRAGQRLRLWADLLGAGFLGGGGGVGDRLGGSADFGGGRGVGDLGGGGADFLGGGGGVGDGGDAAVPSKASSLL